MYRIFIIILLAALIIIALFLWRGGEDTPPKVIHIRTEANGLHVRLDSVVPLTKVQLTNASGCVVLDQRMAVVRRSSLFLYLHLTEPGQYELILAGSWGQLRHQLIAPAMEKQGVISRLLAPYVGRDYGEEASKATVAAGGVVTCALLMHQSGPGHNRIHGAVALDPHLELLPDQLPDWIEIQNDPSGSRLLFSGELLVPGQDLFLIFRVRSRQEGQRKISVKVTSQGKGIPEHMSEHDTRLTFLPPEALARNLEVTGHWLPTGITGLFDQRKQADVICYKPPILLRLARWLGADDDRKSYWMPYTYQSLALANKSDQQLHLVVKARVAGLNDKETTPAFTPPDIYSGGLADNAVTAASTIPPGGRQRVVLPIFITSPPRPGHYRRHVVIYPMGGDQPLKTLELSLYVTGLDFTALGFTLGSLVVSLIALGVLGWRFKSLLNGFKVRQVVIIALFGALIFAGVNLPVRVFGPLFHGLMGPFSVLVVGFFSELLYYSLLVTLIRMIPRPGVVSLLTLVRYLLAILITGGFHITDFLYVGTSIAVNESALYLAGVTHKDGRFSWSWPAVSVLALFLALGDGLLNAAGFYVHMVLFRLYFADWFIALNVMVNGFAYTALGVMMGKRFSDRLVWVEE